MLRLRGLTLKGKNRIHEHGEKWRVCRVADETDYVNTGWLFVEPTQDPHTYYARWIAPKGDVHFEVLEA